MGKRGGDGLISKSGQLPVARAQLRSAVLTGGRREHSVSHLGSKLLENNALLC